MWKIDVKSAEIDCLLIRVGDFTHRPEVISVIKANKSHFRLYSLIGYPPLNKRKEILRETER